MRKIIFVLVILLSFMFAYIASAQYLPVDKAFQLHLQKQNANEVVATWDIAEGCYLYKHKISISLAKDSGTKLGTIDYPQGVKKHSEVLGDYQIYKDSVIVKIPVLEWGDGETLFLVKYQGCHKDLECYFPVSQVIAIDAPITGEFFEETTYLRLQRLLHEENIFWIIICFFGVGILLSLTPCILPMIPILASIVINQTEQKKTYQAFFLSLAYVLGMATTYAIAGILTAYMGQSIQAILQDTWVILVFSLILVLLSLSLFGFYELQLPSFLRNKLTAVSNKLTGGSLITVAIMGALASLIVSPCLTAPLAAILIYLGLTGNVLLSGSALFSLGLGMGVLLIIAGTSSSKLFIKAGSWMQIIKYFFGVFMLAMSIWIVGRVIPHSWSHVLWGLLLSGVAVYMGALEPVTRGKWSYLKKMLAFFILITGASIFLRAFLLEPPVAQAGIISAPQLKIPAKDISGSGIFTEVSSSQELDAAITKAKLEHKPILLDYYADWCEICKEMDVALFKNIQVQKALKSFMVLRANLTKKNAESQALKDRYKVFAPPEIIFIDPSGKQISQIVIAGPIGTKKLLSYLEKIKEKYL